MMVVGTSISPRCSLHSRADVLGIEFVGKIVSAASADGGSAFLAGRPAAPIIAPLIPTYPTTA